MLNLNFLKAKTYSPAIASAKEGKLSPSQRGFTLIELLVVIAIIGILSGIVLTSLGTARTKAKDASAVSSMSSMRAQAELYFTSNYGTGYAAALLAVAGGDVLPGTNCTVDNTNALVMFASDAPEKVGTLLKAVCAAGATAIRAKVDLANAQAWAVQATLLGGGGYCIDSSGATKSYAGAPTAFAGTGAGTAVCV